jgi:hypothetical protein
MQFLLFIGALQRISFCFLNGMDIRAWQKRAWIVHLASWGVVSLPAFAAPGLPHAAAPTTSSPVKAASSSNATFEEVLRAAAPKFVMSPAGLSLSNGAPLDSYRAGPAEQAEMRTEAQTARVQLLAYFLDAKKLRAKNPALKDLSVEEIAAIKDYSDSSYESLNYTLWHRQLPSSVIHLNDLKLLISALNKLPKVVGIVKRSDNFTTPLPSTVPRKDDMRFGSAQVVEARIAHLRELNHTGKPLVVPAFWSASKAVGPDLRERLRVESSILMEVESKSAVSVAAFSTRPEEEEVIFKPGTQFDVISVETVEPRARQPKAGSDFVAPYIQVRVKLRER